MMPLGAAIGLEARAQKNLPTPGERRNLPSVAKYLVANQGFVCAPGNCTTGLLRHILRRALRRAGLPELRFHYQRHMAGTLMHEAGVSLKRAQGILGHASERTTLAIYTHSIRRTHDDSADKIAVLAGLAPAPKIPGNKLETIGSVEPQESVVSDCFIGSRGWNRTNDQRINSPSLYR